MQKLETDMEFLLRCMVVTLEKAHTFLGQRESASGKVFASRDSDLQSTQEKAGCGGCTPVIRLLGRQIPGPQGSRLGTA